MRIAVWLLVVMAICAVTWAEPSTGTVIVSCNEEDASLLVDGVLIPDRTPAVLTLPTGTHVIEARKPPLLAQRQTVEVGDQQQVKVRFELVASTPPPATGSDALGSGSGAPPATGSAQVTTAGSAAPPPPGAAVPGPGSAAPAPAPAPPASEHHCRQGGREVPCPPEGPHCTSGGKPVPCPGAPLPPRPPPPAPAPATRPVTAVATGSGASPTAPGEPHAPAGLGTLEIATTAANAIAYVDGAPVRDAPCVLDLEPGEHVVAVSAAGVVPAEAIVHVEVGRRQRVELIPSKPRQRIDVPAP